MGFNSESRGWTEGEKVVVTKGVLRHLRQTYKAQVKYYMNSNDAKPWVDLLCRNSEGVITRAVPIKTNRFGHGCSQMPRLGQYELSKALLDASRLPGLIPCGIARVGFSIRGKVGRYYEDINRDTSTANMGPAIHILGGMKNGVLLSVGFGGVLQAHSIDKVYGVVMLPVLAGKGEVKNVVVPNADIDIEKRNAQLLTKKQPNEEIVKKIASVTIIDGHLYLHMDSQAGFGRVSVYMGCAFASQGKVSAVRYIEKDQIKKVLLSCPPFLWPTLGLAKKEKRIFRKYRVFEKNLTRVISLFWVSSREANAMCMSCGDKSHVINPTADKVVNSLRKCKCRNLYDTNFDNTDFTDVTKTQAFELGLLSL